MKPNEWRRPVTGLLLGIGWLLSMARVVGADWPQWLGPNRDGSTTDSIATKWPADGPTKVWSRDVGHGFSGPAVGGGRLILHQRRGERDVVECLDAVRGGEPLWVREWPATYRDDFGFDDGPRATPSIVGGRVYTLGAEGTLSCLEMASGAVVWRVAMPKEFGADKGFFGFACSPLVMAGQVMLNVGGRDGAGVVALDAGTGKLRWKATSHEAGYAAPVAMGTGSESKIVFFTREGLVVVGPVTGAIEAEFPWRARQSASVNAATPLVVGKRIFLTSSYGVGAVLLEWTGRGVKKVWSGDESLSSHYASVVHRDGLVYGFHGRQEEGAVFRCVEFPTGKVRWTAESMGSGSVLLAKDVLLILSERGELVAASATPERFQVLARAQVLGTGVRAYPALAGGRFYARDPRKMVCLELAASTP